MRYFKFFNEEEKHHGFQYTDGLNTDTVPFNHDHDDRCGLGLYFSDEPHIMGALSNHHRFIREVTVPIGVKQLNFRNKYRAPSLFLHHRRDLREVSTWEWLVKRGVDVTIEDSYPMEWASKHGYLGVVKFLSKKGAGLTTYNNAIEYASGNGHLDVVKFLVELVAGVDAYDNQGIRVANMYYHLEVVEYLLSKGAKLY